MRNSYFINYFMPALLALVALTIPALGHTQQAPVPVFVAKVERKSIVDELEALGTLQANENVDLTSTVTELVSKVNFDDGQRVKKGDVLIEMDAEEEIALKAEEQSRIREAERQIKRLRPLIARGSASESAIDDQRLQLRTAQARMRAIESRIRQRQIVAPFDGVLGQRNISVGALSQPGRVITTIDDDSVMKLDFAVPEIFLPVLRKGTNIVATASAWPNRVFTGTISSVNSRVDSVTRSISVRALLKNPDYKLLPGLLMRVQLQKNPRLALVIPEEALVASASNNYVMVVVAEGDKTTVDRRAVELGTRRQGEVEILSGLEQGESVVTHGTLRVRSGGAVVVKAVETNNETLTEMLEQQAGPEPVKPESAL